MEQPNDTAVDDTATANALLLLLLTRYGSAGSCVRTDGWNN